MSRNAPKDRGWTSKLAKTLLQGEPESNMKEAEATLKVLASGLLENSTFLQMQSAGERGNRTATAERHDQEARRVEASYRALVEQIPAVVFMAYLEEGVGEVYVSPQIETALGFSQSEWLEDPVRWYNQIYPDDKRRWSVEAAEMFASGKKSKSAYRVLARDGRVLWFQCEAAMIRRADGRPWFIHGVGVDVTELKRAEEALQEESNVLSGILDIVGALVVVIDSEGRIIRFNRACEQTTGYSFAEVHGKLVWDMFVIPEEVDTFRAILGQTNSIEPLGGHETYWLTRNGPPRLITWSSTVLASKHGEMPHVIVTGIDITEHKRLEKTIMEVSAREQRRIGEDLHDGLGQHLTGIAFMSKALECTLSDKSLPEAADVAAKIVSLVNEAINKTRELSRGLLPVVLGAHGLTSALALYAGETQDLFRIACCFECAAPVPVDDVNLATQLYLIARESVSNAIRHAHPRRVVVGLSAKDGKGTLSVEDDGSGIAKTPTQVGMGLNIMRYRASMIGGSLDIRKNYMGGTTVTCLFPLRRSAWHTMKESAASAGAESAH